MTPYVFCSLICHRDFDLFRFNWLASRIFLKNGFDIPHFVLHDGSLSEQEIEQLRKYPQLIIDNIPAVLHENVPNPAYIAKLECFEQIFSRFDFDQAILIDCDVFFLRPWDAELLQIVTSQKVVCLRDWGSSIGPHPDKFWETFGVLEDHSTPNCNTGILAIRRHDFHKIEPVLKKHLENPFPILGDQGVIFAAFYGNLEYLRDIKCVVTGAEDYDYIWSWMLEQSGLHINGLSTREKAKEATLCRIRETCPKELPLKRFPVSDIRIAFGIPEYDTYDFTKPFQAYPSSYQSRWILDAFYLHGGGYARWDLPPECEVFTGTYVCLDNGNPAQCKPALVNGIQIELGQEFRVDLKGSLEIRTEYAEGAHTAFLIPLIHFRLQGV